jgi:hypothetical protein
VVKCDNFAVIQAAVEEMRDVRTLVTIPPPPPVKTPQTLPKLGYDPWRRGEGGGTGGQREGRKSGGWSGAGDGSDNAWRQ